MDQRHRRADEAVTGAAPEDGVPGRIPRRRRRPVHGRAQPARRIDAFRWNGVSLKRLRLQLVERLLNTHLADHIHTLTLSPLTDDSHLHITYHAELDSLYDSQPPDTIEINATTS